MGSFTVNNAALETTSLLAPADDDSFLKNGANRERRADCCCFVCPSVCCRSRRHVLVTVALVVFGVGILLACAGVGAYYGTKAYIQNVADASTVELGRITLEGQDGSTNTLWMEVEAHIIDDTFATADFDDIEVFMYRGGETMPFGTLATNTSIHIIPHKDNVAVMSGEMTILNMTDFSQFGVDLYNAGTGDNAMALSMKMTVSINVLGFLSFKDMQIVKQLRLNGLEKLGGIETRSIDLLFHNDDPAQVWIDLLTCFNNPSNVTIRNLGHITQALHFTKSLDDRGDISGTLLAVETSVDKANMLPGDFCVRAVGPSNPAASIEISHTFENYLNGRDSLVVTKAPSVPEATDQTVFQGFLGSVTQNVRVIPYGKGLVAYSTMDLPSNATEIEQLLLRLVTYPFGSVEVTGTIYIDSPFSVPFALVPKFELYSHGILVGETLELSVELPGNAVMFPVPVLIRLGVHLRDAAEIAQVVKVLTELLSDHHATLESRGAFSYSVGTTISGALGYNQTISVCGAGHAKACQDPNGPTNLM